MYKFNAISAPYCFIWIFFNYISHLINLANILSRSPHYTRHSARPVNMRESFPVITFSSVRCRATWPAGSYLPRTLGAMKLVFRLASITWIPHHKVILLNLLSAWHRVTWHASLMCVAHCQDHLKPRAEDDLAFWWAGKIVFWRSLSGHLNGRVINAPGHGCQNCQRVILWWVVKDGW